MDLKKKSIYTMIVIALSGVSTASDYAIIVTQENNQYSVTEYVPPTQRIEHTEWLNTGVSYDCDSYSPLIADVYNETEFTQSRNCSQDQKRTKTIIDVWSDGSETVNDTQIEEQTIIEVESITATGSYVAESCLDILNHNGNNGDGIYEIKNNNKLYNVSCNMTIDGGGWTIFGTDTVYNLLNVNNGLYNIEILSSEDLINMSYIKSISTENALDSDWVVTIQADDSINPSSITYKSLDLTSQTKVEMMNGWNNTQISLNFNGNYPRVYCTGANGTNNCGLLNKPNYKQFSPYSYVTSIKIDPRGSGSKAHENQWHRNKSTVTGTKFLYMFR